MSPSSSTLEIQRSRNLFRGLLLSGLLIGLLDGTAACISAFASRGTSPVVVFQYVASGVFGREAFSGGLSIAAMGLLFHFIIALSWTALFFLLYPRADFLSRNKILAGMAYGLFVWLFMSYIVVPLSNVPPRTGPPAVSAIITGILIHMFVIGVPISLLARRHFSNK